MHGYETHLRGSPIERNGAARHERRARIDIVIGRVVKRTRRPKAVAVHAVRTRHLRIGQIRGDAGTVQIVHESVGRLLQRKHLDVFAAHQIHDLTRIGAPFVHIARHQPRVAVIRVDGFAGRRRDCGTWQFRRLVEERILPERLQRNRQNGHHDGHRTFGDDGADERDYGEQREPWH